jgi:hypothetical protein
VSPSFIADFPHPLNDFPGPRMVGVGHVYSANVDTRMNHALKDFFVLSGGAYCENYFSFVSFSMHIKVLLESML